MPTYPESDFSGMTPLTYDIRALDTAFVNATESLESVIRRKFRRVPSVYRNRVTRGVFALGQQLVRTVTTHHAGMGDQVGLTNWEQIAVSVENTNDACRYTPEVIDSGFNQTTYTGYTVSKRTKNICLNDIKWSWEFQQQVAAYFGFLADVTARIWETWGRENYIKFCTVYVLTTGGADSTEVTYDPLSSSGLTISNVPVSTLKWEYLEWYHQMLSLGCPEGALSHVNGFPTYGLVIHPKDWHDMIHQDSELREDFRQASPQTLLDNYGTVPAYKGFMIIGDMEAPRWKIEGISGGNYVLNRIVPYVEKRTTKGTRWVANPDYVSAEIAMGVIFLNDVYRTLVPPTGPAKIGNATFGVTPGLMGEFKWINIPDVETNMLGENGFYFARYQAFAEPGENYLDPIAFVYRRCTEIDIGTCEADATGSAAAVAISSVARYTYANATLTDAGSTIDISGTDDPDYEVLTGELGVTIGAAFANLSAGDNVSITGAGGGPTEAIIKMISDDGLRMVVETTWAAADFGASPQIRPEGLLEVSLGLADKLACGVGAEVTIKKDATAGAGTVAAVISEVLPNNEYVFAVAATIDIAELTVGDGPTVTCD